MAIFLILGIVLGSISVLFVFQNITPITITFLFWHLDGSLALVLFLAFFSGILTTLLFLLPGFIRDEWQYRKLKKHVRGLEAEVAKTKQSAPAHQAPVQTVVIDDPQPGDH